MVISGPTMPMLVNDGAPLIVGGTNQDSLMLSKPISKLQKISAGIAHVLNLVSDGATYLI